MTPEIRERLNKHRQIRQSQLLELAALLDEHQLTPDAGPLRDASALCLGKPKTTPATAPDSGRQYWGYKVEGLQLRLEAQRHCRPRALLADSMVGRLTVEVEEYIPQNVIGVDDGFGHIRRLDAQFVCDAEAIFNDEIIQLRAAWHVDTHLHTSTRSGSVHPRFHFQVGGKDLADFDEAMRGIFLTEAPRPPIAPLDAILAVDFVLSHYCGQKWEDLRLMEARYGRVRLPSMKRYWTPYFCQIAEALAGEDPVQHQSIPGLLLPNLVIN